ncbi:MAG: hypothetical protein ABSG13_22400 [Bryobacteraceae bacterium]|jgi:ubiquinone/menaquinone biosynthesis C-methylase UbiE
MQAQILEKIVAIPRIYDGVQRIAGREENYRRLMPFLLRAKGEMLLDTGAGTGEITRILDPTIRYTWLDIDPQKLSGFRQKCREVSQFWGASRKSRWRDRACIPLCAWPSPIT